MSELKKKMWAVVNSTDVIVKNCTYDGAWRILRRKAKLMSNADASGLCVVTNDVANRMNGKL